jgi:hypothetical protein
MMPKPTAPEPAYREGENLKIALIQQDVVYIKDNIRAIKDELDGKYVTADQFDPIKRIVYGLVGAILLAVVSAIAALLVRGE